MHHQACLGGLRIPGLARLKETFRINTVSFVLPPPCILVAIIHYSRLPWDG